MHTCVYYSYTTTHLNHTHKYTHTHSLSLAFTHTRAYLHGHSWYASDNLHLSLSLWTFMSQSFHLYTYSYPFFGVQHAVLYCCMRGGRGNSSTTVSRLSRSAGVGDLPARFARSVWGNGMGGFERRERSGKWYRGKEKKKNFFSSLGGRLETDLK